MATTTNYNLKAKEFRKEVLKPLCEQLDRLLEVHEDTVKLPPSGQKSYPDGRRIGRKEMNSLVSQYKKEIMSLEKYLQEAKRKKPKKAGGKNGFNLPRLVSADLKGFFADTTNDLGPAYLEIRTAGVDEAGQPTETVTYERQTYTVKDLIAGLTRDGVTSSAMLTTLFLIYSKVNSMKFDPKKKQFLKATPLMDKFFEKYYKEITEKDLNKKKILEEQLVAAQEAGATEKEIKALQKKINDKIIFDPTRFRHHKFQTLVSRNLIPKESLQQAHLDYLKNDEVIKQIAQQQRVLSDTLSFYRENGN